MNILPLVRSWLFDLRFAIAQHGGTLQCAPSAMTPLKQTS